MRKRFRPIMLTATLLAVLLTCVFAPSTALAATGLSNDNHTDTDDYCLRAHDVRIGLSEFSTKTRGELEHDIVSASAFAFFYRSDWSAVTSGYTVNFSNLEEAVSSAGYPVTVTLDAVSMSAPSHITFRVFVVDDTPTPTPSYPVTYAFVSATPEHTLPDGVLSQLPAEETAGEGETITPSFSFSAVRDGTGEWTFSGWLPESQAVADPGIAFVGSWSWTELPVYTVSYTFVSGSDGRALPAAVLAKLPSDSSGVQGDVFTPPETYRSVHIGYGVWRFKGWDISSRTIEDENITFTGTWRWYYSAPSATDSPEPTSSEPPATPTLAITPQPTLVPDTPLPSESAASAIQAVEQIDNNTPATPTGGPTGGLVKMLIAATLSVLVATQAFAVVSDLKVLNWYNAKKAARRMKV